MDNCKPMFPAPDVPFNWHVIDLNTPMWKSVVMRGEPGFTEFTPEEDAEFEEYVQHHDMWFSDIEAPGDECGGAHSVRYYFTAHKHDDHTRIIIIDNQNGGVLAGLATSVEDAKECALAHMTLRDEVMASLQKEMRSKWN